jgi:hypothetical protein
MKRSTLVALDQETFILMTKLHPYSIFGWDLLLIAVSLSSKVKDNSMRERLSLMKTLNSGPKTLVL